MARPKKNNALYFTHDADMRNHEKIKALRRKFGNEGYAVWCMLLELLTSKEGFKYKWNSLSIELAAGDFDVDLVLLTNVIEYLKFLELITVENETVFSDNLIERFSGLLEKRNRDNNRYKQQKETEKPITDISVSENTTITDISVSENTTITDISVSENTHSILNNNKLKETKIDKSIKNILKPENFQLFSDVVSLFDSKYYKEEKWLDCYDKLIRIDNFPEEEILKIVKEHRSDGNWWKDNANFETLPKLREKNKEGVKYIDVFKTKLQNKSNINGTKSTNEPTGISNPDVYVRKSK